MPATPHLKYSLVHVPPAVEIAPDLLRLAVEALGKPLPTGLNAKTRKLSAARRLAVAHAYARAVDWTAFDWYWLEGGLEWERRDRSLEQVYGGIHAPPNLPAAVKREVLERDGFRCRYCHLRVITSPTMTALEKALPAALPMGRTSFESHRMQCVLRLTWDHIKARSVGGTNTAANVVVTCGACNFNKGSTSLEELGLQNPLEREPLKDEWDGLNGSLGSKLLCPAPMDDPT